MVDLDTIWLIGIIPAILIYGIALQLIAEANNMDYVERFIFGAFSFLLGCLWWFITPIVLGALFIMFISHKIIRWLDAD